MDPGAQAWVVELDGSHPYSQNHPAGSILGFFNKILIVCKVYEVEILAPKKTPVTLETFQPLWLIVHPWKMP